MGLAICKQLVELHGGSIRVVSPGEGQGSTFTVELPISLIQAEDEHDRVHPAVDARSEDMLVLPKLDGKSIFVVDDEADARYLLARIFEEQGAIVTTFSSAEAALDGLSRSKPSVLVSDIGMPGMDGYQMMRAFRATEPRDARVPALALTAFARAEDRKRALLAGYQAHLAKPFDLAELLLLVADLVER